MVYFQTKNPNLGKFWSALDRKMLIYFRPSGIFYGHLGDFITIWYIFPGLVSCTKKNLATLFIETIWLACLIIVNVGHQGPILRPLNLHNCYYNAGVIVTFMYVRSRLHTYIERFRSAEGIIFFCFQNAVGYSGNCKFLH
jgi:hypothetical protein